MTCIIHTKNNSFYIKASESAPVDAADVIRVDARDYELTRALQILGREPQGEKWHMFFGDAAKEIVANWTNHR